MSINIEEVIKTYIELRDTVAEMDAQYAEKVKPIKQAMAAAEKALLEFFERTGQTSANVKGVGMAYRAKHVSVKVADWPATLEYIKSHDLWHMLEQRVNKTAVTQFLEVNGELPPGVSSSASYSVNIRR